MIVIQKQAVLFEKMIGKQSLKTDTKYRLLNYVVLVEYEGKNLLFNNLTKELLLLSEQEAKIVNEGSLSLSNETVKILIEKWFYVSIDSNDILLRNQVLDFARALQRKEYITLYDIVTTTACNARCFYCFEAGTKPYSMTEETALDVVKFLKDNYDGNLIHINWFGGEPLCNTRVIDTICNGLSGEGINFRSTMTTNGSLFNKDLAERGESKWNLKMIQITLDGPEDTYNRVKAYKNMGANPFKTVIDNIAVVLDAGIAVMVRLNVDEYNIAEIYELVDLLARKFIGYSKFSLYAHLLFENTGFIKKIKSQKQRDDIAVEFLRLCEYIDQLGLRKRKPLEKRIATYFCLADNPEGVLISPSGLMSRCENLVEGFEEYPIRDSQKMPIWNTYRPLIERCAKCAYFPSCLRLNDCPHCSRDCEEYEQKLHLDDLNEQIIEAYKEYLKHNNQEDRT